MTGVNHRDMNTKNKYVILKALATQGAMPRNELSMLSGLSKTGSEWAPYTVGID